MFIKHTFEKEYSDYAEGIIEPGEFYKFFYFFLKLFQVRIGPIPKWTYLTKTATLLFLIPALALCFVTFYHGIDTLDLPIATEAGTYIIVLTYKLLMLLSAKIDVTAYHCLQQIIGEDFLFICTKGEKYRERFFRNQIETRKICKLAATFSTGVGIGMNFFTTFILLYYVLTHEPGVGKRPLLFPFWFFEIDFSQTPIYEIAFMFSNINVAAYTFNYSFIFATQIVWIRHIACKADIVIWHIEDLLDGIKPTNIESERKIYDHLIRQRMKEIIEHHYSMNYLTEQFARVYKKMLMFEQMVSAPVVCMGAYSACEQWEEQGTFNGVLIILLIGAVTVLFVPSYLCTYLSNKVTSVGYACWNIPFWNASPAIRPYLILIMQKSQRPLPLKVPGFEEFSVQTFSNFKVLECTSEILQKMATAYSFFNMLRQANKK